VLGIRYWSGDRRRGPSSGAACGRRRFHRIVESAAAFGITQADIAEQLGIAEKTLRKHFREELNGGKFKVDMLAGKAVTELMKSKDERVRLDAAKYYTARRKGWKETNVNEQVGKDGGQVSKPAVAEKRRLLHTRRGRCSTRQPKGSYFH
jgi:predicted transcriptional regulator